MPHLLSSLVRRAAAVALVLAWSAQGAFAQMGPILTGQGPINRSMGGASTAAPIDSIGALFWNPATTSALPNSVDIGAELVLPQTRVRSSIPANGFRPGIPPISLSGATDG